MGRPPTISRDQLLAVAQRVFAAKGFDAATLADIAGELKITPAAVLRHVPSKHALFAAAMHLPTEPPAFIIELATIDAAATDPRDVLRGIAEQFIPFARQILAQNVAVFMYARALAKNPNSPPRRGIKIVEDYFRRAAAAGVIRIDDPRAAARLFMGSIHSYVFLHHVLNIPPYPVDAYIDALIDLWTHGGIRADRKNKRRPVRDHRDRAPRGGDRNAALSAQPAKAARARPLRNAGGANGERRLARRRPHRPRSRR